MHDHGAVGLPLGFTLLRLLLLGSVTLVASWSLLRAVAPAHPGERSRRAAAGAATLGGIAALLAAGANWMPDQAAVVVIALLVLPPVLRGPRPLLGWSATAGVTAVALAVGVAALRAPAGGTAGGTAAGAGAPAGRRGAGGGAPAGGSAPTGGGAPAGSAAGGGSAVDPAGVAPAPGPAVDAATGSASTPADAGPPADTAEGSGPDSGPGLDGGSGLANGAGSANGSGPDSGSRLADGAGPGAASGPDSGSGSAGGSGPADGSGQAGGSAIGDGSTPDAGSGLTDGSNPAGISALDTGPTPDTGSGLTDGSSPAGGPTLDTGPTPDTGSGLANGSSPAGGSALDTGPTPDTGSALDVDSALDTGSTLDAGSTLTTGSPLDAVLAAPPSTLSYLALIAAFAGASWLALCPPTRAARVVGGAFGAVLLAALGHVTASGWLVSPTAGDPLLSRAELGGGVVDVLVVPHMPGWNLVQTSDADLSVGNSPTALVPAEPVAGHGGRWALVWLDEGRGELWLAGAGARTTVVVDTGKTAWTGRDVRGPDGPDYASAVLAARLAGGRGDLPLPELSDEDAGALRAEVAAIGGPFAVRADASPRSARALEVVRAEADRLGVPVDPAAPSTLALDGAPTGDHLAPWLAPPDLSSPQARRYATVLAEAFPDARPTTSGLRAWLTTGA
ncbi:DUF6239 family natural product biosynthesis protein [Actinosynnema pretiosum]|uniref:DUF6239 family natural product biosynthesis protein n=1 Tax=Actinosynnema pretiosum TaxID=42197 RepID=UPI0031D55FD2